MPNGSPVFAKSEKYSRKLVSTDDFDDIAYAEQFSPLGMTWQSSSGMSNGTGPRLMEEQSRSEVAQLVERSRSGDHAATDQLMTAYRPYLRLLACRRLPTFINKRVDGSDIVQQTLIDAMHGLNQFRGQTEGEFTAWMLKLLERNLLQSARLNTAERRDIRREVQEYGGSGSAQLLWRPTVSDGSNPQNSVFRGESALLLAEALEQLPEDQRMAVELRYLGQQSLRAIAEEMERSVGSVAGLIRRGVEALQAFLPAELGELT
jgi:RNA polymerase sigma-70 factor, ECF subfamily